MKRAAFQTAEVAARTAYGRLVAYLSLRSQNITAAEDALSEAFLAALESWPDKGIPDKPEAWLMTAARRKLIDQARHADVKLRAVGKLKIVTLEAQQTMDSDMIFPDERLKLLFTCAHPAIDHRVHTPLMLQTVLGLSAEKIANAFIVSPTTMGQRLVRAKAKIKAAGIRFEVPDMKALPERLTAVLEAIYAAYGTGWESFTGDGYSGQDAVQGLTTEAIWLGRVVYELLPTVPEVKGLLALMLYCESRRPARRDAQGRYVPLRDQDVSLWTQSLLREAESLLMSAGQAHSPGRFQLEAAIQSVHAQRAVTGITDWETIALLYEGLVQLTPTLGACIGRAAAIAEVKGASSGLAQLAELPAKMTQRYQPYWALKAHLHQQQGELKTANHAYDMAMSLTTDSAILTFLAEQRGEYSFVQSACDTK